MMVAGVVSAAKVAPTEPSFPVIAKLPYRHLGVSVERSRTKSCPNTVRILPPDVETEGGDTKSTAGEETKAKEVANVESSMDSGRRTSNLT